MLNVQALTQTLSAMPLNQLQQYAQLHRNDPYVVTMALSIANQKKQAVTAQQGQAGMQPQPKVVDSEIAQMAPQAMPEDTGIGQLPAGNMNFADGGIVGYADGGEVQRYAGGGELLRTTTGGKSWFLDVPSTVRDPSVPYYREIPSPFVGLADKQFATKEEALVAYNQLAPSATTAAAPKVTPTYSPDDYSGMDRRIMSGSQQPSTPSIAPPAVKAAPTADNTRRAGPGAGPSAQAGLGSLAANQEDPFSMASIRKAQTEAMGDSNYKIGELNNQLVDIRNKAETQVQQRLDDRKKEIETEGDVYKDRSDRLVERAKSLAGQKDQNTGLALLNAGLAIMSTPGGLMTAIGKGAQVGTAQYAAGIKDLRAAQERLDEANDRISELRMNRKDLNSREIRALEKDRDAAILDGQKMVFGFAKDVYGMDRKQAEAAFTSYMSGQEKKADITSRERISASDNAARERIAQLPQGNERIASLLGNGDLAKGLAKFAEIQAGKFNPTTAYTDYLSKRKEGDSVLTPQEFVTQIRSIQALMSGAPSVYNKPTGKAFE